MVDSAHNRTPALPPDRPAADVENNSPNDAGFDAANGAACGLVAQLDERAMLLEFERERSAPDAPAPISTVCSEPRPSDPVAPR